MIYSQIESARTKGSVMHLTTFIHNQHIPQLYQDHLNWLDCLRMAENSIFNIQLHLRKADFKISILSAYVQRLTTY